MDFKCSKQEFREMKNFFFPDGGESKELDEDSLTLILVVLGVKPGGAIYRNFEKTGFEEALENCGLEYRTPPAKIEDGGIDNLEGWEYLITRNRERLNMMDQKYESRRDFDVDLGVFCGYPEEDTRWFVEEGKGEWPDWRQDELAEISVFAFYRPKPHEENIEEARKDVKKHREALKRMDEVFQVDLGGRLLNSLQRMVKSRDR